MRNGASSSDLKDICVAGITPFTTIDFPGRLAGVFYLQGCPWRCRYCYNSEFWLMPSVFQDETRPSSQGGPPAGQSVPLEKVLQFLDSRKSQLDGIVFSGGEPTVHEHLSAWMKTVKDMGFEIGLHTGGMFPERLGQVLPFCDWVGLDIKAPFRLYEKVTQIAGSGPPCEEGRVAKGEPRQLSEKFVERRASSCNSGGDAARESAELLVASGVAFECRTTVHPRLLSEADILEMAGELSVLGVKNYAVQAFHSEHCPDKELRETAVPGAGISANLRQTLKSLFPSFHVRE
jgi:pyruvate formate lyase activating enzyme